MPRHVAQSLGSELVPSELDCLRGLLRQPGFLGPCLEVGTAAGGTLWEMMACFPDAQRPRFIVVDTMQYFPGQAEAVHRNLRNHGLDPAQVDFRTGSSDAAFLQAEHAGEAFGFILIDACHKIRQVTQDLRWTRLLRVGGVVCLHDYGGPHRGVTLSVDRFLRRHSNYQREQLENSLLVLRKTAPTPTPEINTADLFWAAVRAPWLQLQVSLAKRRRRLANRLTSRPKTAGLLLFSQMTAGKFKPPGKKNTRETKVTWFSKLYNSLAKRSLVPLFRLLQKCSWPYRFVSFFGERIGHLALEPDLFLKEGLLKARPEFKEIWLVPSSMPIANRCLFSYWTKHIRTVQSPWLAWLLQPLARDKRLSYDVNRYAVALNQTALYPQIQAAWRERPPLLRLDADHAERGWRVLQSLGVPKGAWFVCIHNREAGFSPHDDPSHAYRNASIQTYFPAMRAIAESGGWCIRMGDKSVQPLPPMPRVIDYATHELKSDWMDIFLCAQAKCFLGCSSGLAMVSTVFGVPVAMANQIPLAVVLPVGTRDLAIPKLYWSQTENRPLTFKEVFSAPWCNFRFTNLFTEAGVKWVDNSPDEIGELLLELLEIANATVRYTSEDEQLQKRFKSLMQPGHYSFGACSRISRYFLRKYSHLLADA